VYINKSKKMKNPTQNNKENSGSQNKKITLKTLYYLLGSVFIAWIIAGGSMYIFFDGTERGTIGDMFGVINALFSGLAFGGVLFAILLQKNELKVSLDSLSKSASAQAESSQALINQSDIMLTTAKLNGQSALLTTYLSLYNKPNDKIFTKSFTIKSGDKVIKHIKKIEDILDSIDKE